MGVDGSVLDAWLPRVVEWRFSVSKSVQKALT